MTLPAPLDAVERALALWRGTPYADLASWPPARRRGGAPRRGADGARGGAGRRAPRLGEHAASVADAERLVREAPLRERRWVLLATALYRGGRQADALAAIRAARERLADELGAEPGAELSELELRILRHDDALDLGDAPASPSAACPYRGLQPFGVEDEDDFFGRDADIEAALARLGRSRFLAVSGASGSGKSSLVRAGVVPALQRRGDRVVILTPEHDLDARIREAVWSGRADVVIVDQFEEVFHAGEADVDAAARAIAEATVTGATVVLVVRSDFLDDCAAHPDLAPLVAEGVHLVGPMAPAALREAIEEPARRAGLRLESGLVELILRDAAGEAGALPHLSHALVETWLRREGATLTVAGLRGLRRDLGRDRPVGRPPVPVDGPRPARDVPLAPPATGGPRARRQPRPPQGAVQAPPSGCLAGAGALDAGPIEARDRGGRLDRGGARVARDRVAAPPGVARGGRRGHAHSSRRWPRPRRRGAPRIALRTTCSAARACSQHSNGATRRPRDLTDVERAFLDASAAHATAEQEQLEERARQDRRQNRRLRVLLGVAAGLIVLLAGAGSVAVVSSQEANAQRDSATIEALVATSLALQTSERDVSALLAAEAYRRWPDDPRTRSGLMSVLQGRGRIPRYRRPGVERERVSEASSRARSTSSSSRPPVMPVSAMPATGDVLRELDLGFDPGPTTPAPLVEVSGDGRVGAVLWSAQTQSDSRPASGTSLHSDLVVFDLERAERIGGPTRIDAGTGALAVNADGSIIAVADFRDGAVTLVSTSDGQMRGIAEENTPGAPRSDYRSPHAAALAFDGRRSAPRRTARRPRGRDRSVRRRRSRRALQCRDSRRNAAMAVGDSGIVVASGDFGLVAFEPDRQAGALVDGLRPVLPDQCNWIALSESMQRVYCGSRFGRISVFDLARRRADSRRGDRAPLRGRRDDRRERRRRGPDGCQWQ